MKTKTSLPYTLLASLLYPQVKVFLFERFLLKPVLIQTFLGNKQTNKITWRNDCYACPIKELN